MLLLSRDGVTWFPYTDGEVEDKFFPGNSDSLSETTHVFACPHEARYVRLNPLAWVGHPALAFDLIGCRLDRTEHVCKPLPPPQFGVVDCEMDGAKMFCTGYCKGKKLFQGADRVVTRTCTEPEGVYDKPGFPQCVDKDATLQPEVNITGYCMEIEADCYNTDNGDYQFCADCHYFSTCSHGYLYVRACPVGLKFDALNGVCDYHSRTCSSRNRHLLLAEQRIRDNLVKNNGGH